jgi:hypothetical protein
MLHVMAMSSHQLVLLYKKQQVTLMRLPFVMGLPFYNSHWHGNIQRPRQCIFAVMAMILILWSLLQALLFFFLFFFAKSIHQMIYFVEN